MERKQTPDSLESISKACDEAEDLLAALDESDQQKKASEQTQNTPIEQNKTSIAKSKTKNEGAVGCLTILGICIAGVVAAVTNQENMKAITHSKSIEKQCSEQKMQY